MTINSIFATLEKAAGLPLESVKAREDAHETQAMDFVSSEMAPAGRTPPVILQENHDPVAVGQSTIDPLCRSFAGNVVDPARENDSAFLNAITFGPHCVQVIGAADGVRAKFPGIRVH